MAVFLPLVRDANGNIQELPAGGVLGTSLSPVYKTGTFTAVASVSYLCNVSGGGFTVNCPASASAGDCFELTVRCGSTFSNYVTLSGNGANVYSNVLTATSSVVVNGNGTKILVVYDGSAWEILPIHAGILDQATASNSGSLELKYWYSPLWKNYEVDVERWLPASSQACLVQISSDGGSTYLSAANYQTQYAVQWINSSSNGGSSGLSAIQFGTVHSSTGGGVNFRWFIVSPSTSAFPRITCVMSYYDSSLSSNTSGTVSGVYAVATTWNAFKVYAGGSANTTSGTIRVRASI